MERGGGSEPIQTALAVFCVGKCVGENNGSTIDSVVLAKVLRGRSSGETAKIADWQHKGHFKIQDAPEDLCPVCLKLMTKQQQVLVILLHDVPLEMFN